MSVPSPAAVRCGPSILARRIRPAAGNAPVTRCGALAAGHWLSGIRCPAALSSSRNTTVIRESLSPFISATDRRERPRAIAGPDIRYQSKTENAVVFLRKTLLAAAIAVVAASGAASAADIA